MLFGILADVVARGGFHIVSFKHASLIEPLRWLTKRCCEPVWAGSFSGFGWREPAAEISLSAAQSLILQL
jgi:hypothetical protein